MSSRLNVEELERYARHIIMPEVGRAGQERLKDSSVLLVGAGGLGSPAALYLAAAGIGRIGVADFDAVDLSNLQRQVLHRTRDVGRPKAESARERIEDLNPHVIVVPHSERLDVDNAMEIVGDYDIVVDGTDNFPTRYLTNDACALLRKPYVYGSIFRFEGQASVFHAGQGPCYRCLFPEPPPAGSVPSCAEAGVLGILPGIVGTIQAAEAVKLALGQGRTLLGRLLLFNALEMSFEEMRLHRDPGCAVCGEDPTITGLTPVEEVCEAPPAEPVAEAVSELEITVEQLSARLDSGDRPLLVDVRTPGEWEVCRIGGALLLPLHLLPARLQELDREAEIVLYCHVGVRSALATQFLLKEGFRRVRNLIGGIDAWSLRVDPSVPRY
jgi:adenylyltransferase/sulfurtransferase